MAGWLLTGAASIASAQSSSNTRQLLLFDAVRQNNLEQVRSIISAGIDVARPNAGGTTAVDLAVQNGHFGIAQHLILTRRLQQQSLTETVTEPAAAPRFAPPPPDPVQSPPVLAVAPIDKLLEATSNLTRAAEQIAAAADFSRQPRAPAKSIPRIPAALRDLNKAKITPPERQVSQRRARPVPKKTTGDLVSIGNDGSLQAIGDDAFKTMLTEAALAQKSAEEISAGGALAAGAPPFWPQPGRKPSFAVADADAGNKRAGAANRAPLKTVTDKPAQAAAPQPPSDIRRPAGPGLERLRRRLKTMSRSELKKQTESKKKLSEKKAEKRQVSANKTEPLFLNKIVNSIGGLLGIDSSAEERSREETRNSGGAEAQAEQAENLTGTAPPPAAKDLNPFDPAAVPMDARLPDAYAAPPPKRRPVQPVKIAEIKRAPTTQSTPAAHRINITARRVAGASDTPPDLAEPLTRLEEQAKPADAKPALPMPAVEQQLARISAETRPEAQLRTYTPRPDGAVPLKRLRRPLTDIQLSLGDSVSTGQPQLPRGLAEPQACITKQQGKVQFCVVPVDWPVAMEEAFSVNTLLYQGTRAIARYDAGKTSHLHTLFDAQYYEDVRAHLMRRFGPPTDRWERTIAPFNQPRQPNPTLVWRSRDTRTDKVTILELRRFDDTRSVFPDTEHGALRLYTAGAPKVFPVVTALDIMSIEWTARSDHLDGVSPVTASTLAVGR
ncbi:MAG: hypothetical protein HN861_18320 [Rhodospirillaceae bacterium]|nr:hypothetical protein [Rhodospirillaceae bacterium]